ncbi:MAG TPA: hypothetical protein VJT49_16290 [Amycolatopsis sp.]|uniref:hypothetical protein n=1 Tax=Amycolatopsis sp. TaxID=37632 RepID=UPI002B495908|nr:hypothetical protein [Amycolatopsis sp.]HKS46638.1 hypothetical protein [Amycolatopsis sp.]
MIRYQLALLAHSQRYLLPMLVFLVFLGVLYGNEANTPAPPEYAASAGALAVIACWLTIALVDIEDPVQWLITLAHARRLSTVVGGIVLTVLVCCTGLTVLSLLWSVITHHGDPPGELVIGALAHFACAGTGIAIGLPASRLLVPRVGYTVIAAGVGMALVLLIRWIPLVNPILRELSANDVAALPVLLGFAVSLLVLAGSSAAVAELLRRLT